MFSNGVKYVLNLPLCNVKLLSLNKEFWGKLFFFFLNPIAFFFIVEEELKARL